MSGLSNFRRWVRRASADARVRRAACVLVVIVASVVAYVAPLGLQLARFGTIFQFPTAFIPAADTGTELRQRNGADVRSTTAPEVAAAIARHQDVAHGTYIAPAQAANAGQQVAGAFDSRVQHWTRASKPKTAAIMGLMKQLATDPKMLAGRRQRAILRYAVPKGRA